MKTIKLTFHPARVEVITKAIEARDKVMKDGTPLVIDWHPYCGDKVLLECSLDLHQVELLSEALSIWGEDTIRTRTILDHIIFKLLLQMQM